MSLPPLPRPFVPGDDANPRDYYTAEQMREYARAAVAAEREACAALCDDVESDRKAYADSSEIDEIEGEHVLSQAIGAADCATDIRARGDA